MHPSLLPLAQTLSDSLRERKLRLITAESCTGGMIAALLTELPGSSDILTGGFVSYANAAKQKMLGVSPSLLEAHGAVSSQVAQAMAEGALRSGLADISIAVTGIAGPGGGSAQKPVGTVYIAAASTAPHCRVQRHLFTGDRHAIREATTLAALKLATELLKDNHYRNSG